MSLLNRQKLQQKLVEAMISDIYYRHREMIEVINRYIEKSITNHKNPDTVCEVIRIFYDSKLDFLTNLFKQRSTKITTIIKNSSGDEIQTLYSWVQGKTPKEISKYLDEWH